VEADNGGKILMSKYSREKQEMYEWYKGHGICPQCRIQDAEPGKTLCFDCLEKARVRANKYNKKHVKEKSQRDRERYYKRKEEGRCVKCGKPSLKGTLCVECAVKNNRRGNERNHKEGKCFPDGLRTELGICKWCNEKAVDGSIYCEKHLEQKQKIIAENAKKCTDESRKLIRASIKAIFANRVS
jgi:hypothetical protein